MTRKMATRTAGRGQIGGRFEFRKQLDRPTGSAGVSKSRIYSREGHNVVCLKGSRIKFPLGSVLSCFRLM